MNTVGMYLLYLLISAALTLAVGTSVARSGRAFLLDVFGGNEPLARAVSRLLVVGFYLLSLGFVTLTMRGGPVTSAASGLQLLSVKIGEVLLVLGALHLLTMAALLRARRLAQARLARNPFRPDADWSGGRPPARRAAPAHTSGPDAADAADAAEAGRARPEPGTVPLAGTVLR